MSGSSALVVRRVETGDVTEVAEIERQCFGDPWSEQSLRDSAGQSDIVFLVAAEAEIDGYLIAYQAADVAELANLAVRPGRRGQGIARALLAALGEALRSAGVGEVWLEVRASNDGARRLYEKWGFVEAGLRKRYYSSPVEDAVVMRMALMRRSG